MGLPEPNASANPHARLAVTVAMGDALLFEAGTVVRARGRPRRDPRRAGRQDRHRGDPRGARGAVPLAGGGPERASRLGTSPIFVAAANFDLNHRSLLQLLVSGADPQARSSIMAKSEGQLLDPDRRGSASPAGRAENAGSSR